VRALYGRSSVSIRILFGVGLSAAALDRRREGMLVVLADIGTPKLVRVPVVDRYFLHAFPKAVSVKSVAAIDGDGKVVAKSP
jgi:hypothetical protein